MKNGKRGFEMETSFRLYYNLQTWKEKLTYGKKFSSIESSKILLIQCNCTGYRLTFVIYPVHLQPIVAANHPMQLQGCARLTDLTLVELTG